MSDNDIYIRRISNKIVSTGKTAVRLYEFLNRNIEQRNLKETFGKINYVTVINNTKLKQDDFVGVISFEDRDVHKKLVEEFNEPLLFAGRQMIFEINFKETSTEFRTENRNRFETNLEKHTEKRYFNLTPKCSDEDDNSTSL
ncbi:unnamed protein product [Brachionus calyciflorus]|uniref:RRM domain-containing protein n=1 Tax=Brachionus calyciflorus TaxID=104777 RepID=A0A813ZNQ3_9BILA|nr:unnamed protein product [Brachionus calyciflorus]